MMRFLIPAAFPYVISSRFNAPRDYSFAPQRLQLHEGIDFAPQKGAVAPLKVAAAADGEIVKVGFDARAYGNYIIVRHEDGWDTWYCHLAEPSPKQSGFVLMGEFIGNAGNTGGTSTGTHLHFNVCHIGHGLKNYVVADVVDPEPLLITQLPQIVIVSGLSRDLMRSIINLRGLVESFDIE